MHRNALKSGLFGDHRHLSRINRSSEKLSALLCVWIVLLTTVAASPTQAQLRGHGGPVRALSISADGSTLLSGSFDGSAIRWSLGRDTASQVFRFHADAVNATALLPDGRAVTAGADGRIAIWTAGKQQPDTVLEGHAAPIASLAVSTDGATLASASWDRTVRLWSIADGKAQVLEGHTQNVNGVTFSQDGRSVISASYDLTLRIWPRDGSASPTVVTLPAPLNAVASAKNGDLIVSGANGSIYVLDKSGALLGDVTAGSTPIIALSLSPDGELIAAADIRGSVAIVERATRELKRRLVGPGLPVWSVAFMPDSKTLLTGGADTLVRRWDARTGEPIGTTIQQSPSDPLATFAGDRGATVFRACVACHTLTPDEGNKAGPTLSGIFGRRIATLPGYNFSEPLKKMDIVWTPDTVAKLFEVGPTAYTPGTKMPEQIIGSAEDRKALVDFLARVTK